MNYKTFCFLSFILLGNAFVSEKEIKCTDNVLRQIYPNQNACVLQASIPKSLRGKSYITYPIEFQSYNTERFNFNKRFNVFPKAIIHPKCKNNLAKVIKILRKKNLNFSVRSGGHCFEPGSLSSDYIVDLSGFNKIRAKDGDEVCVEAGVRLGPLIEFLGKDNRAIPTGTCQSVGVSGLALGGGIGFLTRTYGLTCDAIKKITLLNADGEILEVDEGHYPDLFWALRGAGNNSYGIALEYTFKTFYVPSATYFELKWNWDPLLIQQIFNAWHAWIAQLPDTVNPVLEMDYVNGQLTVAITGLKVGKSPFIEWESAFKNLNPQVRIQSGSYVELAQLWADSPTSPFAKVKSLMAFQPISNAAMALAIDYLQTLQASQANFQMSFQFVALGGEYAKGSTAFFPRAAVEWWHLRAKWDLQEEEAAALASLRAFYAAVAPLVSNFCYTNDTDYDLGEDFLTAYYGDHVDPLIRIKRKYDPTNFFKWRQSIPLN